jgi:hypothetical protein
MSTANLASCWASRRSASCRRASSLSEASRQRKWSMFSGAITIRWSHGIAKFASPECRYCDMRIARVATPEGCSVPLTPAGFCRLVEFLSGLLTFAEVPG